MEGPECDSRYYTSNNATYILRYEPVRCRDEPITSYNVVTAKDKKHAEVFGYAKTEFCNILL
jgi:hypothetical protein